MRRPAPVFRNALSRPQMQDDLALMRAVAIPNGLAAIGYVEGDIDRLVEGTAPQHRVTKLSPRPVTPEALRQLFRDSMVLW